MHYCRVQKVRCLLSCASKTSESENPGRGHPNDGTAPQYDMRPTLRPMLNTQEEEIKVVDQDCI